MKKLARSLLLIGGGVAVLTAASGWLYSRQSLFRLSEIRVQAEDTELAAQAQKKLMDRLGKSLFVISFSGIEEDLAKIPAIRKVNIRRRWPSTLVISLEIKDPVAMTFYEGKLWGLDSQGNLIDVLHRPRSLPLIKFQSKDFETRKEVFSWLDRQRHRESSGALDFSRIDELMWTPDRGLIVKSFESEIEVELGFRGFDAAWERAEQAVVALRSRDIRANYLDATYRHRVVASRLQNFQNGLNLKGLVHRAGAAPMGRDSSAEPPQAR